MCTCSSHAAEPAIQTTGALFKVEDMTCHHCAGTIRNALREAFPGALVAIDMEEQTVQVDANPDTVAAILRQAGYEPQRLTH